jgi:peptidoglycan/xylan/chitin deacetylase (PgdA/CDA1 family)
MCLFAAVSYNHLKEPQVVEASERIYISETSGLYTDQFSGSKKGTMKASYVNVVEAGGYGWYKVNTWLGQLWVKNGFLEEKSPELPIEYAYLTSKSGLFKEQGKILVSSLTPQRVAILEKGIDGWLKIHTWLGPLWTKNGVMAEEVLEPIVEPEPIPTEPVKPVEEIPSDINPEPVVEETPEEPVVPVVIIPEPVVEVPSPPAAYLKIDYVSDIFDIPNGAVKGTVAPTTLTVIEAGTNGWYLVKTWLGPSWVKEGYIQLNGYEKPILPSLDEVGTINFPVVSFPQKDTHIGYFQITKASGMYADPTSIERLGVLTPQLVYLIERGADGWVKINSNWGQVWVKDGFNAYRSYFSEVVNLHDTPTSAVKLTINPSFVLVKEERVDGWKRVETWLGDKWTKNKNTVLPIQNYADKTIEHIYIKKDTAIMEKMMYDYENVGIAKGGQYFVVLGETDTSYMIDFGYGVGHINKADAEKTTKAAYSNRSVQSETNNVLITKKDSIVYDLKGAYYHQIGTINVDMRYPIVKELTYFYVIDFGGREGYVAKSSSYKDTKGIPTLMYHHFLKSTEYSGGYNTAVITPEQFDKEMAIVKKEGFSSITPEMMEAYVSRKGNLPGKSVLITSDDGYKSNYQYMYPIMKKYNLQGTIFIITSYIQARPNPWLMDSRAYMSIEELGEASKAGVFNYHCHTDKKHYANNGIGAIASEPYNDILADTKLSKEKLEFFGYKPRAFAYPLGSFNQTTVEIMKEAGYTSAYTIKNGFNKPDDKIYELKRWNINPNMPEKDFLDILYSRK